MIVALTRLEAAHYKMRAALGLGEAKPKPEKPDISGMDPGDILDEMFGPNSPFGKSGL